MPIATVGLPVPVPKTQVEIPAIRPPRTTVLLADPHRLVRAGLRRLLEAVPGLEVVGEAGELGEAIALTKERAPELVVMELAFHDRDPYTAITKIYQADHAPAIVVVSLHAAPERVAAAMRAGATGFVSKSSDPAEFIAGILAVRDGNRYFGPGIVASQVEKLAAADRAEDLSALITRRQQQILQLLAQGRATKEIASDLGLSVKTVETHRAALMQRTGCGNVAALVKLAYRYGVIGLE